MTEKEKRIWTVRWGSEGNYTQTVTAHYYRQEGHLIKFYTDEPSESELDPMTRAITEVAAYSVFGIISLTEFDPEREGEETDEVDE